MLYSSRGRTGLFAVKRAFRCGNNLGVGRPGNREPQGSILRPIFFLLYMLMIWKKEHVTK